MVFQSITTYRGARQMIIFALNSIFQRLFIRKLYYFKIKNSKINISNQILKVSIVQI